jgi:DNA-binding transcriptional ArsR family regulator
VNIALNDPLLKRKADLLSVMGNPTRLEILRHLFQQEWTVGALASRLGLNQSALSQHLAKLRLHELVNTRREAQTIYYSGNKPCVRAVLNALGTAFADTNLAEDASALHAHASIARPGAMAPSFALPWQSSARVRT